MSDAPASQYRCDQDCARRVNNVNNSYLSKTQTTVSDAAASQNGSDKNGVYSVHNVNN